MLYSPVLHLHLPLYLAFPTLGIINARTVTFASFGVNPSGKRRYVYPAMSRRAILTSTKASVRV